MILSKYLLLLFPFINVESYISIKLPVHNSIKKATNKIATFTKMPFMDEPDIYVAYVNFMTTKPNKNNIIENLKKKATSFCRLIRYVNIIPTALLSISSGFIINPSIADLIRSSKFITGMAITQCIMWNSMIINDLFDMNIDKINSPNRPLVTGEISKREAIVSCGILLGLSEFLNLRYLPTSLHWVTHIANTIIILYTPILKKVPFIKNISCALLVSFANIFAGLTVSDNLYIIDKEKLIILSISTIFIFLGSLYNELLLDISDIVGDKKNNISTVPVLLGKEMSWKIANNILKTNTFLNIFAILSVSNYKFGLLFAFFIYRPLFMNLHIIKKENYSRVVIRNKVNQTAKFLFIALLLLCGLSYIHP